MKIIKLIIGVLVILVSVLLIAAAIAPTENFVQRSIVINAPVEAVRNNVMSFHGMLKWSPWHERDPNQTFKIENDSAVGAVYSWDGADSLVGAGSQTITKMDDFTVETTLRFIRPWESSADANTVIEQVEDGVKVTWLYHDETPYPMNIMNLFFDMEAMLGADFQMGVDKLKALTEKEAAERSVFRGLTIETVDLAPRNIVGVRDTVGWDEMKAFFEKNIPVVFNTLKKAKVEIAGMPMGVYYTWDETNRQTDMMVGVPVVSGDIQNMAAYSLSGKALQIVFTGDYQGLGEAHLAMEDYMVWHDVPMKDVAIEEYITNPNDEPDANKWITHVLYPISN